MKELELAMGLRQSNRHQFNIDRYINIMEEGLSLVTHTIRIKQEDLDAKGEEND